MKELGMTQTKGSRRLLRNRWKAFKEIVESQESKIPEIPSKKEDDSNVSTNASPVLCEDMYIKKEVYDKVLKTIVSDLLENDVIDDSLSSAILSRYDV